MFMLDAEIIKIVILGLETIDKLLEKGVIEFENLGLKTKLN